MDAGGNNADAGSTVGPVTTLTPQFDNSKPVTTTTVSFTFTSSIAGSTFECLLDGASTGACTSPHPVTTTDGVHTLTVRATAGGVPEVTPPSVSFVIDTTAPATTINSPAAGATIGAAGVLVFSANEPVAKFECAFDAGDFAPCGNGGTMGSTPITLGNGAHTAHVRATDVAGNPGAAATVSFTVDTTALTVAVTPRTTECASEVIAFTASKAAATFSCNLDDAVTNPCTSPFTLPTDITAGAHTFTVTAKDEVNMTATNSLTFTVDRTAPTVQFLGIDPPNFSDPFGNFDPQGTIFFAVNKVGMTAQCFIDGGQSDCTLDFFQGTFAYTNLSDSGNPHNIDITVTDACGVTAMMPTTQFTVDSTPPAPCLVDVATTGGPDRNNGSACLTSIQTSGPDGSLTFNAELGTYSCQISTAGPGPSKLPGTPPPPQPVPGATFSCAPGTPIPFANLPDFGENGFPWTLTIVGTDIHGNRSTTPLDWTVDATPPVVTKFAVDAPDNTGNVTITYTANEPVGVAACSLDGAPFTACGNASASYSQLSVGQHTFAVELTDVYTNQAGPVSPPDPITVTFGPNAGRLILIGHDFEVDDGNTTEILTDALDDVAWRKTGLFERKLHVAFFDGGGATANEKANVAAVTDLLVDPDASASFSLPADLANTLIGKDILFVYDQNDPEGSAATGAAWSTTAAGTVGASLRAFLDEGGTVIVLDGWVGKDPFTTSDTWQVIAGGNAPLLAIDAAEAIPPGRFNSEIDYNLGADDVVFGDNSELFAESFYDAVNGTVDFTITEAETGQPRHVYSQAGNCDGRCRDPGPPVVVEKVFPVYTVTSTATDSMVPGTAFTVATSLSPAQFEHLDCAWNVFRCDGGSCCGGESDCACTKVNGNFVTPTEAGEYTLELRVIDANGRPARGMSVDVSNQVQLTVTPLGDPTATDPQVFCVKGNEPLATLVVQEGIGGDGLSPPHAVDAVTNPDCVTKGYPSSWSEQICGTTVQLQFTGTDAGGNSAKSIYPPNFPFDYQAPNCQVSKR